MTDLTAEEYKSCRDLFLENVRAMERNEIYALGAIGAVMVYAISASDPWVAIPSSLIPLAIAVIGRMRYLGFGITAKALNSYLEQVEKEQDGIGWICFQRGTDAGGYLRQSRFLLWRVLVMAACTFALLITLRASIDLWN
jgi:hypothetical protein